MYILWPQQNVMDLDVNWVNVLVKIKLVMVFRIVEVAKMRIQHYAMKKKLNAISRTSVVRCLQFKSVSIR